MFGLQKLKDGIDKKAGTNFLYEITLAMDNFPLGCNEIIRQLKKHKDKLIVRIYLAPVPTRIG
jgi:hypothetical protein